MTAALSKSPPRLSTASGSLRVAVGVVCGLMLVAAPLAKAQPPAEMTARQAFDIPSQDLASALDRFSLTTGLQIFYASSLARGLRSGGVQGALAPKEALNRMLEGTGLEGRLGASGVTVTPIQGQGAMPPPSGEVANGLDGGAQLTLDVLEVEVAPFVFPSRQRHGFYASSVRLQVRNALRGNRELRDLAYRVQLNIWLDREGRIARSAMHRSSGSQGVDWAVMRSLEGVVVRPEPPGDLPQPIHVDIVSAGA